jgi:hypothetical protein
MKDIIILKSLETWTRRHTQPVQHGLITLTKLMIKLSLITLPIGMHFIPLSPPLSNLEDMAWN